MNDRIVNDHYLPKDYEQKLQQAKEKLGKRYCLHPVNRARKQVQPFLLDKRTIGHA